MDNLINLIESWFPIAKNITLIDEPGGFKKVFRIECNGNPEALKLIEIQKHTNLKEGDLAAFVIEQINRIRREVEILASSETPNLVRLGSINLSEFNSEDRDFLVYSEEFISGLNLRQIISKFDDGTRIPEPELRSLLISILKVIQYLWSNGYIHRDIKPGNIMKTEDSSRPFVLLDLGIAHSIQEASLTYNPSARLPVATFEYIAPERLDPRFKNSIDYRSDLYSAGLVIYEYATGKNPIARAEDPLHITLVRAMGETPETLHKRRPDLSSEFCSIIDQFLKKQPALRPANIANLIKRMES